MFPATWGSLPSTLQSQFDSDFEDGMGALWESGSHAVPPFMQHMAMFFARYQLPVTRTDAYSVFLEALTKSVSLSSVRFSSLNYDCLFEIAASAAGRTLNYFSDAPASESDVLVWKLHGSCNFVPEGGVSASRRVSYGSGATFGTGIRAVNPGEVAAYCTGDTALYPVMAVYARGKPVQIAREVIERIQQRWATAIKSASSVVTVGLRPNPIDAHIWGPLSETEAKLFFVGNRGDFADWQSKHRPRRYSRHLGERFASCIPAVTQAATPR